MSYSVRVVDGMTGLFMSSSRTLCWHTIRSVCRDGLLLSEHERFALLLSISRSTTATGSEEEEIKIQNPETRCGVIHKPVTDGE